MAVPPLITVEEYCPVARREDVIEELHLGRIVVLPHPKKGHAQLRQRLLELLSPHARGKGFIAPGLAFRAIAEYDVRGSDVAFVSRPRWNEAADDDYLRGSPELVVDILSASGTTREIQEKAALCLSTGTEEFWIVDPDRMTVHGYVSARSRAYFPPR